MTATIATLFEGLDGWGEGLRPLGLQPDAVGIELDRWACRTARAAGHRPIRADVETYPTHQFAPGTAVIASPPCQAFSTAGLGDGRALIDDLAQAAAVGDTRWIAMEQVPSVLPVWEGYRWWLRSLGYSTWTGALNAADYGVPQTRRRAILLASLDRAVSAPPTTHAQRPGMFGGLPWVPWEQALAAEGTVRAIDRRARSKSGGGGMAPTVDVPIGRPAPTLTVQGCSQWLLKCDSRRRATVRPAGTPAGTLLASHHNGDLVCITPAGDSYHLTPRGCLALQSFPLDYPVAGTVEAKHRQIGNAVPPLLAAHCLAEATGRTLDLQEAA